MIPPTSGIGWTIYEAALRVLRFLTTQISQWPVFQLTTWAGDPMTLEHNEQRIRNEPLVEITQVKGTSETHPALSLNDEWASFEIIHIAGGGPLRLAKPSGGYVRDALRMACS